VSKSLNLSFEIVNN